MPGQIRRHLRAPLVALAALAAVLVPVTAASAHSLESSTISTHVNTDGTVDATISVALETLDQALGTDYTAGTNISTYADEVNAYLADHLSLTDADGVDLAETFSRSHNGVGRGHHVVLRGRHLRYHRCRHVRTRAHL